MFRRVKKNADYVGMTRVFQLRKMLSWVSHLIFFEQGKNLSIMMYVVRPQLTKKEIWKKKKSCPVRVGVLNNTELQRQIYPRQLL